MAINHSNAFGRILPICIFLSFVFYRATAGAEADELSTKHKHSQMKEVTSRFTLYWHDIAGGSNPTVVPIIKAHDPNTSFGLVNMIDDPLTLGPALSSKLVGRAQGLYGVTSQKDEFSLLMAMNFVFTDGKYNGSTITIMGRNSVLSKVREMPVIGGSGLFRFARGYVQARTNSINQASAIVKYDIHVMHYVSS